MTQDQLYEKVKECLAVAVRGDDRIDQDDLFELQDKLASLALEVAEPSQKRTKDLVKSFPWMFRVTEVAVDGS